MARFRGVVVEAGESRVEIRYAPRSVRAGALLTLLAFSGTLGMPLFACLKRRRFSPAPGGRI
jgi:hypothetical protein